MIVAINITLTLLHHNKVMNMQRIVIKTQILLDDVKHNVLEMLQLRTLVQPRTIWLELLFCSILWKSLHQRIMMRFIQFHKIFKSERQFGSLCGPVCLSDMKKRMTHTNQTKCRVNFLKIVKIHHQIPWKLLFTHKTKTCFGLNETK